MGQASACLTFIVVADILCKRSDKFVVVPYLRPDWFQNLPASRMSNASHDVFVLHLTQDKLTRFWLKWKQMVWRQFLAPQSFQSPCAICHQRMRVWHPHQAPTSACEYNDISKFVCLSVWESVSNTLTNGYLSVGLAIISIWIAIISISIDIVANSIENFGIVLEIISIWIEIISISIQIIAFTCIDKTYCVAWNFGRPADAVSGVLKACVLVSATQRDMMIVAALTLGLESNKTKPTCLRGAPAHNMRSRVINVANWLHDSCTALPVLSKMTYLYSARWLLLEAS